MELAAVVVAGGGARRFGGVDKLMLGVEGQTLLDRTLDALRDADPIVVVGPVRQVSRPVVWTREQPAGGGPLAGLAAGVRDLPADVDLVAALAGDHPWLTPATVARLANAAGRPGASGAVLVDAAGREQWLVGVWHAAALRGALAEGVTNTPVRARLATLRPRLVPARGQEACDVDSADDLGDFRS